MYNTLKQCIDFYRNRYQKSNEYKKSKKYAEIESISARDSKQVIRTLIFLPLRLIHAHVAINNLLILGLIIQERFPPSQQRPVGKVCGRRRIIALTVIRSVPLVGPRLVLISVCLTIHNFCIIITGMSCKVSIHLCLLIIHR